jgi:heptosyltransferase-2
MQLSDEKKKRYFAKVSLMKHILVIQNKRIGDVLISSVIASNLKKLFPESLITFFVYDYTAGVLEGNPHIDRVIQVNDKELKRPGNLMKAIIEVRRSKYDVIFDPYAKLQSRLMCLFSGAPRRIGFKRRGKKLPLPYYTDPVEFLPKRTKACGKAIENRINLIATNFPLDTPDEVPRIYLREEELHYPGLDGRPPMVMMGILGSTPIKSLPSEYIVQLVDHISANFEVQLLFNYAPHQREEAEVIYSLCAHPERIDLDLYADSIRGFARLMHHCKIMVANEGGSVHIAKALDRPTFTIYSPYIEKDDWNSFEDGINHTSIHLLDEKPHLYAGFSRSQRKAIEQDPSTLYRELTPEMILEKLVPYLDHHLKDFRL